MKRLAVYYYAEGRLSVEVENGVVRQASADNALTVLRSMHPDDLGVLVSFCRAVTQAVDEPNRPSMFLVKK